MLKQAFVIVVLLGAGFAGLASCDSGGASPCAVGGESCSCTGGGSCDTGLLCMAGKCVRVAAGMAQMMGGAAGGGSIGGGLLRGSLPAIGSGVLPGGAGSTGGGGSPGSGGSAAGGAGSPGSGGAGGATATGGVGGSGPPAMCVSAPNASTCTSCFNQNCCAQFTTCNNTPACPALLDCVSKCASNDNACANACAGRLPAGVTPLNNFLDCSSTSCRAACSSSGAGGAGGAPVVDAGPAPMSCVSPANASPCRACLDQNCCAQFSACTGSTTCPALLDCLAKCPATDSACSVACTNRFPTGVAPLNSFLDCNSARCRTVCN